MRTILAALCAWCACSGAAHAATTVQPFRPNLLLADKRESCERLLSAWTKVFDSDRMVSERYLHPELEFPSGKVRAFPEYGSNEDYATLYGGRFDLKADLDGDGDAEVIFIEPLDQTWRYRGASVLVFESVNAFETARSDPKLTDHQGNFSPTYFSQWVGSPPAVNGVSYTVSLDNPERVHVIELDDGFYLATPPNYASRDDAAATDFFRLGGSAAEPPVCRIALSPSLAAFDEFIAASQMFKALKSVYGGSEGAHCDGTMGWTPRQPESALIDLFFRPHALKPDGYSHPEPAGSISALRELRLMNWGLSDPVSWRTYLQLKSGRERFIRDLSEYYLRNAMAADESAARALAEYGFLGITDRIVYGRNRDLFSFAAIATVDGSDVSISTLEDSRKIARRAVSLWLRSERRPEHEDETIWRQTLFAAVYSRQPMETIDEVMERFKMAVGESRRSDASRALTREQQFERNEHYEQFDRDTANGLLLASLGEKSLMAYALAHGADVNARTNSFGKTALMYAAQLGDEDAVKFLLESGADPLASTQAGMRVDCGDGLERDRRTALMYAAENAPSVVIRRLLNAGADPAATDTRGNSAKWYLERNESLSMRAKRKMGRRFEPARP